MNINDKITRDYLQDALKGEPLNETNKIIDFNSSNDNSELNMKIDLEEVYHVNVQTMKLLPALYTMRGFYGTFALAKNAGSKDTTKDSYYFTKLNFDGKFKPSKQTKVRFFMGSIATKDAIPIEPPLLNENQFAIYRLNKEKESLHLVCYTPKFKYKKNKHFQCFIKGVIEKTMDSQENNYYCAFIKHTIEQGDITMPGKHNADYANTPIKNNPLVLRSEQPANTGIPKLTIPKEEIKLDNSQSFFIQFYN